METHATGGAQCSEDGREDLAKRYSKKLRGQYKGKDYASWKPCTMVDKLVEELEKPEKVLEELKKVR